MCLNDSDPCYIKTNRLWPVLLGPLRGERKKVRPSDSEGHQSSSESLFLQAGASLVRVGDT